MPNCADCTHWTFRHMEDVSVIPAGATEAITHQEPYGWCDFFAQHLFGITPSCRRAFENEKKELDFFDTLMGGK